jgi:hypothetical protein
MIRCRPIMRAAIITLSASATSLMGLAPVALASARAASVADKNMCSATINNPHYSTAESGIIAKGRWICGDVPTTIHLDGLYGSSGLYLWLCTDKAPQKSESYLHNDTNCRVKGYNQSDINVTIAGDTYTRYVPAVGGAHGNGWWVACAVWSSRGPLGTGGPTTTFSNVVKVNG